MKLPLRGVIKTFILGLLCASPMIIGSSIAYAAVDTCTWTGGGVTDNFNNSANWSGCDNSTIPENGDSIILPASVDADTTSGDDRILINDIVSLSLAGIQLTGTYLTGDYDDYAITTNPLTLTGSVLVTATPSFMGLDIAGDLTINAAVTLQNVYSLDGIAIGVYAVTLEDSAFDGGITGTGALTIGGLGGEYGVCYFGTAGEPAPIGGDSSGFSGPVTVIDYGSISVTSRSTDLARHASSITLDGVDTTLYANLDYGQDLTLSTPLTLNGGTIYANQLPQTSDCVKSTALKTLTLSGTVTATATTSVVMDGSHVTLSGTVTGAGYMAVPEGNSAAPTLTIGSTTSKSALKTTIYSVSNGSSQFVGDNNVAVVNEGVTLGTTIVYSGGTLKGKGVVGDLTVQTGGTLAPGLSPGCIASGNLVVTGNYGVEIGGTTVCTLYDQTTVTGTVNLTGSTLLVSHYNNFRPVVNNSFIVISNDGVDAVTGTFSGFAQGSSFLQDGITYQVSYTGGDGNDVVLTVTGVPTSVTPPNTGFRQLSTNIFLPLVTVLSGVLILGFRKAAAKKTK